MRLRYQDGSGMAEHMNSFEELINQTNSLEVPLSNEVLALLLLRSLSDSWEMVVVTQGNAGPEGKHLSLMTVKSNLLNKEGHWKDQETRTKSKALVTKTDMNRRRDRN